jgi:hypothetical protein
VFVNEKEDHYNVAKAVCKRARFFGPDNTRIQDLKIDVQKKIAL